MAVAMDNAVRTIRTARDAVRALGDEPRFARDFAHAWDVHATQVRTWRNRTVELGKNFSCGPTSVVNAARLLDVRICGARTAQEQILRVREIGAMGPSTTSTTDAQRGDALLALGMPSRSIKGVDAITRAIDARRPVVVSGNSAGRWDQPLERLAATRAERYRGHTVLVAPSRDAGGRYIVMDPSFADLFVVPRAYLESFVGERSSLEIERAVAGA